MGLYYTKLPNRVYIYKAHRKNVKGCKQINPKYSITLMICRGEYDNNFLLALVIKSKLPE